MEYERISMFDKDKVQIIVTVERPNGTTFEQTISVWDNESPLDAMRRYQKVLGEPYGWYTERGQRIRYIKKDAYLCTGWRLA